MHSRRKLNWNKIFVCITLLSLCLMSSCQNCCQPDLTENPDKNFWTPFGLEGKEVYAFTSTNTVFSPSTIWAGTNGGGVYSTAISSNGSWENLSITSANCQCGINASQVRVLSLGYKGINGGQIIFAGTASDGIFKLVSGNPNVQWQRILTGPTNVRSVILSGSSILAASDQGIWTSTDGGNNWTLNNQMNQVDDLLATGFNNDVYAAANPSGLYKSTDSGATWTNIGNGSGSNLPLSAFPLRRLTKYVNSFSGTMPPPVTAYAASDTAVYNMPPNSSTWGNSNCCGGLLASVTAVATRMISNNGSHYLFVGSDGQGVFSIATNGQWENKQGGMTNLYVLSITTDNQGWVAAGTKNGVFRTKSY